MLCNLPLVQLGFTRVSSHPLLGYGMVPEESFSILRRFIGDPRHRFVVDNLSIDERSIRTELIASGNQITDHYLAALARHHQIQVATFDESFARAFSNEDNLVSLIH